MTDQKPYVLSEGLVGTRRLIGSIFLALSAIMCVPLIIMVFLVLPWPIRNATMEEINRKLPLLWTFWSLGIFALIFALPAVFLLQRAKRLQLLAILCLILSVAVSTLAVPWPRSRLLPSAEITQDQVREARERMRILGNALERYRADHKAYPFWTLDPIAQVPFGAIETLPSFGISSYSGLHTLTTPIAYLQDVPQDPFALRHEQGSAQGSFAYWVPEGGEWWILISPGPDSTFGIDMKILIAAYEPNRQNPGAGLSQFAYDPTNGIISSGDIWIAGPGK